MGERPRSTDTWPRSLTMRQRQVIHLVAAGLTNKEIGHLLGITQRGVSAQISRLLSRFSVTNRAELIAHALADDRADQHTDGAAEAAPLTPVMENQLLAYRDSPFLVLLTVGERQTVWFVNPSAEQVLGIAHTTAVGRPLREWFSGPSAAWWSEEAARTLRTGLPGSAVADGTQWSRDDRSEDAADFTCVFQPVLNDGAVVGVLTICVVGSPTQC
jgi:DNA-binding CsgD family transcriptional regulator